MVVFEKTKGLTDAQLHYCPGCTHGIIHRLVAECLEELGVLDKTVGVASVGLGTSDRGEYSKRCQTDR